MSSKRLPGKALLKIAGLPLAVLSALRAANTGLAVVVAMSDDSSDDILARVMNENEVKIFRGSLNDVLARFAGASEIFSEATRIVRLTADNSFPDGVFIERLLDIYDRGETEYLNTDMVKMPYGLSAEIFSRQRLVEAQTRARSVFEREHVTPWISQNVSIQTVAFEHLSTDRPLRCTIDTFDDYEKMSELWREIKDPVHATCEELIGRLRNQPPFMVLGTAQIGQSYGIVNKSGRRTLDEELRLLEVASDLGVRRFDTANAYGKSEDVLGRFISERGTGTEQIFTKLLPVDPLKHLSLDEYWTESWLRSERLFRAWPLEAILFHRVVDIHAFDGELLTRLEAMRAEGRVKKIGVSLQTPAEIKMIVEIAQIEHLQIPLNLLDWRWSKTGARDIAVKLAERGVTFHARSLYLQGLIGTQTSSSWPLIDSPYEVEPIVRGLQRLADRYSGGNVRRLALRFAKSLGWLNGLVIGADSAEQVRENVEMFRAAAPLDAEALDEIESFGEMVPERLLNPSLWMRRT